MNMRPASKSDRSGSIVVLTAFLLVGMFAMVSFSVDVGYIVHARTEIQRTADACALAAVAHLPDKQEAWNVAQSMAVNNYASVGPDLRQSDIEYGFWDRDTALFTSPTPSFKETNAVRVTLMRSQATGNPLSLFFASILTTKAADVTATATALYDRDLCGPFIGIDWVSAPGSLMTDSYSSDDGLYESQSPGDRAGLCSNGPIALEGSGVVHGDARAGKGYDVTLDGGFVVTKSIGSRLKPLNLPPVDATEAAITNDNNTIPLIQKGNSWESPVDGDGNFLLDGNITYDLPPGTYYFNDFNLEGQAVFNVSGPTTIYITGDLRRAGGTEVNNLTKIPSNLQLLMTGGTAEITSNNAFYGIVYAPNTDVIIDGDAELYGVAVGKTLTVTGTSSGHYDESLGMDQITLPKRTTLVD
jgi:Flp pilus assembly protein TadG